MKKFRLYVLLIIKIGLFNKKTWTLNEIFDLEKARKGYKGHKIKMEGRSLAMSGQEEHS
jgi:hypothetical protein